MADPLTGHMSMNPSDWVSEQIVWENNGYGNYTKSAPHFRNLSLLKLSLFSFLLILELNMYSYSVLQAINYHRHHRKVAIAVNVGETLEWIRCNTYTMQWFAARYIVHADLPFSKIVRIKLFNSPQLQSPYPHNTYTRMHYNLCAYRHSHAQPA